MDAANVDLKAFSEEFYQHLTYSHLQPVLDTLRWLKQETDVWFEITNLIIPQENDSPDEIRRMCDWVLDSVGDDVPVHFTAFHPDFRLRERAPTPLETLLTAYDTAKAQGHQVRVRGKRSRSEPRQHVLPLLFDVVDRTKLARIGCLSFAGRPLPKMPRKDRRPLPGTTRRLGSASPAGQHLPVRPHAAHNRPIGPPAQETRR